MELLHCVGILLQLGQRLLSYSAASSSKEKGMIKYHRYMLMHCLPVFLAVQKLYAAHWRSRDAEFNADN